MITISTSAQACISQPTGDRDIARRVAKPIAATFPHDARESLVRRLQQNRPCRFRTTLNATDSSQQEQTPSRQDLEVELQIAIRLEQYKKAAELRDALKSLQSQDTAFSLNKKLDAFVAEERFEEAAAVRDELRSVVAHDIEEARKRTTSDAVTEGVRVQVKSYFVPNQSYPQHRQYFFAYSVTIKNESNETVQLLSRHWVIHNAEGQKQEVRGPGVVGETPVLEPGKSYEYTSACPLSTPIGNMKGEFEMIKVDTIDPDTQKPQTFLANIAEFGLDMQQAAIA